MSPGRVSPGVLQRGVWFKVESMEEKSVGQK